MEIKTLCSLTLLATLTFSSIALADINNAGDSPDNPNDLIPTIDNVRKSQGSICYTSDDGRYDTLMNFEVYDDMEDCIESGGRLPKNKSDGNDE